MTEQANPSDGVTVADVAHIVFRRKWMIVWFSLLGAVAAGGFFLYERYLGTSFVSEAKILVRYVIEERGISGPTNSTGQVKTPDTRGDTLITTEGEILLSHDLAVQVVQAVGASTILKGSGIPVSEIAAAWYVRKQLTLEQPKRGATLNPVLTVRFAHSDPAVAQQVLRTVVDKYQTTHLNVHRVNSFFSDVMRRQLDTVKKALGSAEAELAKLKERMGLGILSFDEHRKYLVEEMAKTEQTLAGYQSDLLAYSTSLGNSSTNAAAGGLGAPPTGGESTNPPTAGGQASPEQVQSYISLVQKARKGESDLEDARVLYKEEHPRVANQALLVANTRKKIQEMEQRYPDLAFVGKTVSADARGPETRSSVDPNTIPMLRARIGWLTNRLAMLAAQAQRLDTNELEYREVVSRRDVQESQSRFLMLRWEQAQNDSSLPGQEKVYNLAVIEDPTPAVADAKKTAKICGLLLAAGVGLGLGLAFLLEVVLDRSVKRPSEVAKKLKLPLLLWIPRLAALAKNGSPRKSRGAPRALLPEQAEAPQAPPKLPGGEEPSPTATLPVKSDGGDRPNDCPELRPYFEALRDRLVMHFEERNISHKPKLVAIASPTSGAGVSTLARGIAAALSETGDGNVLLVDMNIENGVAHPFQHGQPSLRLDEALENERRDPAMVKQNFYIVSGSLSDEKVPRILPKRFSHLMPRMKASDYDFIIFDMPPVDQTSITPRLASHMDMTMLVVEAEKTSTEAVQQAVSLLKHGKSEVGVVLNKKRDYAPARWTGEA